MHKRLVIIGGGQATVSLIAKLRQNKYEGSITLICDEPFLPYQRPPLSKAYLLDKIKISRLFLKPENYYVNENIDIRLGSKATSIDRDSKIIKIGDERIAYDTLILATGAYPRKIPEHITNDVSNIFSIRNINDVQLLKKKFANSRKALIVGGGYIGLEAAAVCREKGLYVLLVEAGDRILQRVACKETSNFLKMMHKEKGVDIREAVHAKSIHEDDKQIIAELSDGTKYSCDFIISGIGINPNTSLAEKCGLKIDNGISTNKLGVTSDDNIWAVGDCASFPYKKGNMRLESVGNAIEHAEVVAENVCGSNIEYNPKPWFWSDQYDTKLQIAGLNDGFTNIVERKTNEKSVSFWYYSNEKLLAVDAINSPRDYMIGKKLIEAGHSPDKKTVSNPDSNLKELL